MNKILALFASISLLSLASCANCCKPKPASCGTDACCHKEMKCPHGKAMADCPLCKKG